MISKAARMENDCHLANDDRKELLNDNNTLFLPSSGDAGFWQDCLLPTEQSYVLGSDYAYDFGDPFSFNDNNIFTEPNQNSLQTSALSFNISPDINADCQHLLPFSFNTSMPPQAVDNPTPTFFLPDATNIQNDTGWQAANDGLDNLDLLGSMMFQGNDVLSPLGNLISHEQPNASFANSSTFNSSFPFDLDIPFSDTIEGLQTDHYSAPAQDVARPNIFTESSRTNSEAFDVPTNDQHASKTSHAEKMRTKPVTMDELTHDNSRFAKVVKAFLSIPEEENRTVPEIAKKVDELYSGQYADFETVKRMVNDVLQKHRAFWHLGRGAPYHLDLSEGRARREFPSNNRYQKKLWHRGSHLPERYKHRSHHRKERRQTIKENVRDPPEPKEDCQDTIDTLSDEVGGLSYTPLPTCDTVYDQHL